MQERPHRRGRTLPQPETIPEDAQYMQNGGWMNKRLTLRQAAGRRFVLHAGTIQLSKTRGSESGQIVLPGAGVVGAERIGGEKKLQRECDQPREKEFHRIASRAKITDCESE